jgi:hypothetical protein
MQPTLFRAILAGVTTWVWVAVLLLLIGALSHNLDSVLGLGAHRTNSELWPGPALRAVAMGFLAGLVVAGITLLLNRRPAPETATPR